MLLREHRQVILVADRSLNELSGLTADLHARLSGGMACGLEPLDPLTRSRLLAQLCNHNGVQLENSTIEELATRASVMLGCCRASSTGSLRSSKSAVRFWITIKRFDAR